MVRALVVLSLLVCACGPGTGGHDTDGNVVEIDAAVAYDAPPTFDAPNSHYPDAADYPDASSDCTGWECADPVGDGCDLGGPDLCNDGLDQDCDGMIDEGCPCTQGAVQSCFRGPPGRRGVGSCVDGTQTCTGSGEFSGWGDCVGGIAPGAEACDGQDNDCNGCADDNPSCCGVLLSCPGPDDMPHGAPFQDYPIDGTAFFSGATSAWQWTVTGGPCDVLLGNTSFTLSGQNTSMLHFTPSLSGDYTVKVKITAEDGTIYECTFIVHIGGPGLRVETCWDTTGQADIDLHVHKPGTTTPWFSPTLGSSEYNPEDCYYINCKASSGGDHADWGYAPTDLSLCEGGPEGATWQNIGVCLSPRLDVDNISQVGVPENINIDNPPNNATFRVMVHHYGGSTPTHPLVNIYCGGALLATYGQAPDLVAGFNGGGGWGSGPMWRVVDVTAHVSNGVTTGCDLTALHPPGTDNGYWVTTTDRSY